MFAKLAWYEGTVGSLMAPLSSRSNRNQRVDLNARSSSIFSCHVAWFYRYKRVPLHSTSECRNFNMIYSRAWNSNIYIYIYIFFLFVKKCIFIPYCWSPTCCGRTHDKLPPTATDLHFPFRPSNGTPSVHPAYTLQSTAFQRSDFAPKQDGSMFLQKKWNPTITLHGITTPKTTIRTQKAG
jgi:hypothetical protein